MDNFEKVRSSYGNLEYMHHPQAKLLRNLIMECDARDILEIGFFHGKSSAYIASILEDLGRGHLVTLDRDTAREREPNIEQVLSSLDLAHRVTPVYAHRSYTWELAKMIQATPRPQFDLCYFDGGHTWDVTGFGFVLVDILLRPGGCIVFDDLPWTIETAKQDMVEVPSHWSAVDSEESSTPAVKLVFDMLVPHLGYTDSRIVNDGQWGVARKPLGEGNHRAAAQGRVGRLFDVLKRR